MSAAHFDNIIFGQLRLRVRRAGLLRHLGQTVSNRVSCIRSGVAPFKILDSVVRRIAVFVVDVRKIVRIWNVRQRNGAMNQHTDLLAFAVKISAKVGRAIGNANQIKPSPSIFTRASVSANSRALRIRPHAAIFSHCVKPFISRNISHLCPSLLCARGYVTT